MVMVSRRLLVLILLAGTGACHRADYGADGGATECTVDLEACPAGTTCHLGFCLADGSALDAGLGVDASQSSDGGEVAADGGRVSGDAGSPPTGGACRSLEFDGVSGQIGLGQTNNPLGLERDFSISVWLNLLGRDLTDNGRILDLQAESSCGGENDSSGLSMSVLPDRGLSLFIGQRSQSWEQNWTRTNAGTLPEDGWAHLFVVRDAEEVTIFVNGENVYQRDRLTSAALDWPASNQASWIGFKQESVACAQDPQRFRGRMRDLIVWDQALAHGVVHTLRGEGLTQDLSQAIAAHWPMNAGEGLLVEDASERDVDGVMQGGVQWSEDCPGTEPSFSMVEIPAGVYTVGSPEGEAGRNSDEAEHLVRLTRPFAMMTTELTQRHYEELIGSNPSEFLGENRPVERVDWFEAITAANAASIRGGLESCYEIDGAQVTWRNGLDCEGYRLPTEHEREVAARANQPFRYAGSDTIDTVAWYAGNSDGTTHPVAQKAANAWGLYDMSGNVEEWVWDWYSPHSDVALVDPTGPEEGTKRVGKGGGWNGVEATSRVADRYDYNPGIKGNYIGLRLVRSLPIAPDAPRDCQAIKTNRPDATSGVYSIDPDGPGGDEPLVAYCDMTKAGGGWTRVVNIARGSQTWNAWSERVGNMDQAADPNSVIGLGMHHFSDDQDGEDLEIIFAVDGSQRGSIYRDVHRLAWDDEMGSEVFDRSFEYSPLPALNWQTCAETLNHAGVNWNWVITYSGAEDGCRGFNRGNGFLLHGTGEPDIADSIYGLNAYHSDEFGFLRIYVRRSQ